MNFNVDSWLQGLFNSSSTFISFLIGIALLVWVFSCFKKWRKEKSQRNKLTAIGSLVITGLTFSVLNSFQTELPKTEIVKSTAQTIQSERAQHELPPLRNLSPKKDTPEERSKRLEELRKKQDQSLDLD